MTIPLQQLVDDIGGKDYYEFLTGLVFVTHRLNVLELGTGDGHSGSAIMRLLPADGRFTTINWPNPPSGDDVGKKLLPWENDQRLAQVLSDTREASPLLRNGVFDLLFIDSTHEYDTITVEWALYAPKLAAGALVCVDDIDFPGGGVRQWWDALAYEKVETKLSPYGFGVLRFQRG